MKGYSFKIMRILVTGANGFIGQGVVTKLVNEGHSVIATDYKTDHVDSRAISIACDLFNINDPFIFFKMPDVVLHLAWKDGFNHFSASHFDDLSNHINFINKMAMSPVKTISVMGSMHEIGPYEGEITDSTPCNPQNYYGIAKNSLRIIAQSLCIQTNTHFQWLRGYYIVSPSPFGNSIFSKISSAAQNGTRLFPFTKGQNCYDFIDYDVFCNMVAKTVTQNRINGIINICSGIATPIGQKVEQFIRDNNFDITLEYGVFPERAYDSKSIWGNSSKIENIMSHVSKDSQ